jgi:hypothetical protein
MGQDVCAMQQLELMPSAWQRDRCRGAGAIEGMIRGLADYFCRVPYLFRPSKISSISTSKDLPSLAHRILGLRHTLQIFLAPEYLGAVGYKKCIYIHE